MNRRGLLKTGAAAGAAAAALLITPKIGGTGTASASHGHLVLAVAVDLGTFEQIIDPLGPPAPPEAHGPFHVSGVISGHGITGSFHCWGYVYDGGAVVTQEYDLAERGKIIVAGVESSNSPRPVTGGSGEFSNVGGDMTANLDAFFAGETNVFTAVFRLIG